MVVMDNSKKGLTIKGNLFVDLIQFELLIVFQLQEDVLVFLLQSLLFPHVDFFLVFAVFFESADQSVVLLGMAHCQLSFLELSPMSNQLFTLLSILLHLHYKQKYCVVDLLPDV